jgi:DNA primase
MGFHEAVAYVADRVGMELPAVTPQQQERHTRLERLRAIVSLTSKWMGNKLYSASGQPALSYLQGRGIGDGEISDFKLGYAPGDRRQWQDLIADMTSQHGYRAAELIASGVFRPDERGAPKPFFLNRLMFTICDLHGRPIAFAGRRLGDDGNGPKYINTAECELFARKGEVLYNAHRVAEQMEKTGQPLVIAEGYLDVIAMQRDGLGPAVCCMGTAVTEAQISLAWKINRAAQQRLAGEERPNVPVFCLDGDAAGLKAAESAARLVLPEMVPGRTVKFARLPEGEDPASLLQRPGGADMLRDAIGAARTAPWILYEAEAGKLGPMATVEDRAALAAAVERNILDRMRNRHLRSEYAKEFWRRQNHRPSRNGAARGGKGGSPPLPRSLAEPALLAALLYHPPLFHEFIEDIGMLEFSSREIRDARDIVISGLSAATDDGDLLDRAGNLIDGCPAVQEMVLTDAVFVAAPFVLPGIADDVVRSCIQDVLLNMQISSTQQEVDLLMGMLDGSETDRQVVDKITVLLSSLRV